MTANSNIYVIFSNSVLLPIFLLQNSLPFYMSLKYRSYAGNYLMKKNRDWSILYFCLEIHIYYLENVSSFLCQVTRVREWSFGF